MSWASLFLLVLSAFCAGARAQLALTQPSSASVVSGQDVHLPCTLASGYRLNDYWVRWYQQKPGSAPRFVYIYRSSSSQDRGPDVPDRFSGTGDTSSNLWSLVITGARREDDADYHCQTHDGKTGTHSERNRQVAEASTFIIVQLGACMLR
ncbi:hypothetical protein NDU88_006805 [Pleurodeles waltl]|uniref:Ig-like domain-containing protein n=1 Tax=Pleurodeles waltl TaxID=8319 RepID=A0AAV7LRR2_PLEWA|nr:hypothetical protein NDU88_006805 [Pleurodeles waltl]